MSTASAVADLAQMAHLSDWADRLDFTASYQQQGRMLQISTALPWLALLPERLTLHEALGQPFELAVDCISTSAYFELKRLIGEQMSLRLLQPDGSYKPWHGYVFEAAQLGADGGLARYRLVMRPWLSFLKARRDCFVYQDMDARAICESVFADYPQANFRFEVTETLRQRSLCVQYRESDFDFVARLLAEEGLTYHHEHDDSGAPLASATGALHALVVTDRSARRPQLGAVRFAMQHPTARLDGQRDAVTAFGATRRMQTHAVTLGSWNYRHLAGTTGQAATALDVGDVPELEHYDGAGAYRYEDAQHAQRAAELALTAFELDIKRFEGHGSARHFEVGRQFELIDHPLYGAGTSGGAIDTWVSHARADNAFTLLAIEHHVTNNLGAQAAQLLQATELEHGTYRNHFHACPAAAVPVPRLHRRPTAPGLQTALVVGIEGEPLTTDRDLRVKVQFPWQRGRRPLPGGLGHDARSPDAEGNAPGTDASGTWVRVASPAAGANWGAVFTPRIGTEVAVGFVEGDIDRPVVLGALYNGQDLPPWSAGADSGINHPGVISGLHTHHLDHAGCNQWLIDDATAQLRMRTLCSYTLAEVGLGHLIAQTSSSAQRGPWRGSGFELATQAWASVRAHKGLWLGSTARAGSYGSAQSTQMDADESVARLRAARELGQALSRAARHGQAHGLASHDAGAAVQAQADAVDPTQRGRHDGAVGGQRALQADAQRNDTAAVHASAEPLLMIDSTAALALATPAHIAAHAAQDFTVLAHDDLHLSAAHTHSSVSGRTTSLYTRDHGAQLIAANGPVSLRAHTDTLQVLADQELTVVSVTEDITVDAPQRIELFDGHSSIVLEGGNITFTLPGLYSAHHATHEFMPPGGAAVDLPALPKGSTQVPPLDLELNLHDEWLQPVAGSPYVVVFEDGSRRSGTLDDAGHATETGVPNLKAQVFYGEQPEAPQPRVTMPANTFSPGGADNAEAIARIEAHLDQAQQFYAESASAEQRELHIELNGQHDNGNGENLWNYLDEAAQQALRRKLQGEAP